MKRLMILPVDNDRAQRLIGEWTDMVAMAQYGKVIADVPRDDQLMRDLDDVTQAAMTWANDEMPSPHDSSAADELYSRPVWQNLLNAAQRLREAAGLEEPE